MECIAYSRSSVFCLVITFACAMSLRYRWKTQTVLYALELEPYCKPSLFMEDNLCAYLQNKTAFSIFRREGNLTT